MVDEATMMRVATSSSSKDTDMFTIMHCGLTVITWAVVIAISYAAEGCSTSEVVVYARACRCSDLPDLKPTAKSVERIPSQ